MALQFLPSFAVPGCKFTLYLQEAYKDYPFVVSFGVSELSKKQLIADLTRMKTQISEAKKKSMRYFDSGPIFQKMIFVEMTRNDEDPSPFEGVANVHVLAKQYTQFCKSFGLTHTFDAVISPGHCKSLLLSLVPRSLLDLYPDIKQDAVDMMSICTTTAAAILCYMTKQDNQPSTFLCPSPCVLFASAWRVHARELPGLVSINGSFHIGLVNFTICSLIEHQVDINHFITHCVTKSGHFIVDDMSAEIKPSGIREHGITAPTDRNTFWRVASKLVMLFAVRDEAYKENLQPRLKGIKTVVEYISN